MPSLLLSNVPGAAGLWRVAPMPTYGGQPANAENGGSALTVLQLTRKPDAAYRFVDFVAHDAQGISARVDGGAFPADYATLNSADFLDKTTITNDRGIEIPYFGGQKFNRVLSEAAEDVSVGYQYLPFEVYARSDFKSTVGQAYEWSGSFHAYQQRQEAIEMGMKDEEGRKTSENTASIRALRLSRDSGLGRNRPRYTRPIPAYYVTSHCASRCAPCP